MTESKTRRAAPHLPRRARLVVGRPPRRNRDGARATGARRKTATASGTKTARKKAGTGARRKGTAGGSRKTASRRRRTSSRTVGLQAILNDLAKRANRAGSAIADLSEKGADAARGTIGKVSTSSRQTIARVRKEWDKLDKQRKAQFVAGLSLLSRPPPPASRSRAASKRNRSTGSPRVGVHEPGGFAAAVPKMTGNPGEPPILSFPGLEEPIRAELYSIERLEESARALGKEHGLAHGFRKGRPLLPRLRENGRVLLESYRAVADAIREERTISPAAEWLVDNFHIVEEQLREIRDDMPQHYYRELPKLDTGPLEGYPRVYALTTAFVAHTDSRFAPNPEALRVAYQTPSGSPWESCGPSRSRCASSCREPAPAGRAHRPSPDRP